MKKTNNIALIACVLSIFSIGAYSYMLFITTSMSKALTQKVTLIANSSAQATLYNELRGIYDASQEKRQTLSQFALTEDEAADFLNEIEAMGVSQGLTITTDNIKIEKNNDIGNQLVVQFSIAGEEIAVRQAIILLEKLPYKSIVTALVLNGEEEEYRATIDLSVTLVKHDR